jgi:peptidoglycan DL-endopeptidase CwlO
MTLTVRICLLVLCLAALSATDAVAASHIESLPAVANPARLPRSVPLRPVPRPKVARSLGQRAVRIAGRELGVPYRYGGSSPSGFDCSGLVAYVYGKLGVSLPHNAAAQYGYGRPVDRAHLQPGDLLFFHGLGHVGLYIGGGRMIHAPQSGERVEIQSLAARSGSVEGARRIRS